MQKCQTRLLKKNTYLNQYCLLLMYNQHTCMILEYLYYTLMLVYHADTFRYIKGSSTNAVLLYLCLECTSLQNFPDHIVSGDGVETDPGKIAKIEDWPTRTKPEDLRSFHL